MGFPAEPSLLTVGIVHVVATLVPAAMGLAAVWLLGVHRAGDTRMVLSVDGSDLHHHQGGSLDVSVVIPAHNSGALIDRSVAELLERLQGTTAEIILVENGSTDDTFSRCASLAETSESVTCIRVARGMGNALRAGAQASRGRWVLLTADDLPFGFSDLDGFERMRRSTAPLPPVLIGSKAHPDSRVDRGHARAFLTRAFAVLRLIVLGMRTGDPQGTLIIDGSLVRQLSRHVSETGFLFTTELVYICEEVGLRPTEIPVELRADHGQHRTRISLTDIVRMAVGLLRLRARHHGAWRASLQRAGERSLP
jgi:glycosyltransferase involved in cell wall biosynthesis